MISEESAVGAVAVMAELIAFFPRDENAQLYVVDALREMVSTERGLKDLVKLAVNSIRKWESLAHLRELYARESERAYLEASTAESNRLIASYREQKLLAGDVALAPELPPELPEIKRIAPAGKRKESRTERDLREARERGRLAAAAGAAVSRCVRIAPTPLRTPEERHKLQAELSEQVRQYQLAQKGKTE